MGQEQHARKSLNQLAPQTRSRHFKSLTSDDINNLTGEDLGTALEKQLYVEIQRERKRHVEHEERVALLVKKLDDMASLKRKYDALKREHREVKQMSKDAMAENIEMQKSIEQEAIYLATQNSNLIEEREGLLNELDPRNYEITMLNQQLQLQRQNRSNNNMTQSMSEAGNLAFMDSGDGDGGGFYGQDYEEEYDEGDVQEQEEEAEEEHDELDDMDLDDILEDPNLFDGMDDDEEDAHTNKSASNTAKEKEKEKEKE